jgi:hypothetical protein
VKLSAVPSISKTLVERLGTNGFKGSAQTTIELPAQLSVAS